MHQFSLLQKMIMCRTDSFANLVWIATLLFLNSIFLHRVFVGTLLFSAFFKSEFLGKCHPSFEALFPYWSDRLPVPRGHGHSKQLYGHWMETNFHRALYARSIFAMIDIYNNLPQHVVDAPSVSIFQSYLMQIARTRCQQHDADWASSFCRRAEHH